MALMSLWDDLRRVVEQCMKLLDSAMSLDEFLQAADAQAAADGSIELSKLLKRFRRRPFIVMSTAAGKTYKLYYN